MIPVMKNIATKLHSQFAVDSACDICIKYKKKKPKPIVGLPLSRTFSETDDMDLKE